MKIQDLIKKRIEIATKKIIELNQSGDLKKLSDTESYNIGKFYEEKSRNRLETAKLIYIVSNNPEKKNTNQVFNSYKDYAESVAAAYYSMYYIVHAFLAAKYKTKLREGLRGVHILTEYIILYYLVSTKKLAKHLYDEYMEAFDATVRIQKISLEDFQEQAYKYAEKYGKSRDDREIFTYNVTSNVEAYHAERAIHSAEEFINTIRQLILSK